MDDPNLFLSDDETARVGRSYFAAQRVEPAPAGLEARTIEFALSRRRSRRTPVLLSAGAFVLTGAITASVIIGAHSFASNRTGGAFGFATPLGTSVLVTRDPGFLILPPIQVTVSDPSAVSLLASEIASLPPGHQLYSCPISFGTAYTLKFTPPNGSSWTARVPVGGCGLVAISDGRTLSVLGSRAFWSDLASVLDMPLDQVEPVACGSSLPPGYDTCYPQASSTGVPSTSAH